MNGTTTPAVVVFDLGGVLIDWDPDRLYRKLIEDPAERSRFLAEVCSPAWHDAQDRGRSGAEATAALQRVHPGRADLIAAFYDRWPEMFGGALPATVEVLRELDRAGVRLLALTNWPAEKFADARSRFPFLSRFEGIVVSGEEGVAKPDEAIFRILLDRYSLDPASTVYIDDNAGHVQTAARLGMTALRFGDVPQLRRDLSGAGLPVDASVAVRSAVESDLPALIAIYNWYVENSAATFDLESHDVGDRREWFDQFSAIGPYRLLVAVDDVGRLLGFAYSGRFRERAAYRPSIETSVYLKPDAGGRGVGSMLYQQLFAEIRREDLHRCYAVIALPNDASVALHRRFGFEEVGRLREVGFKHGDWWDVAYLEKALP